MSGRLLKTMGITFLTLAFASACSNAPATGTGDQATPDTPAATGGETIKIGGMLPLTGDGAAYGLPAQAVAEIALAKVNEAGGVNGQMIEIIWEDGKCNGTDAANGARKLIDVDGVSVILGAFCSSETLGMAPIAEQAGVVVLSPGSSSPDITNAGDYIFRNYPSDNSQAVVLAKIAEEKGYKKVGSLTEVNDYTVGIDKAFTENFSGEVITETFLPDATDMRTQITKLVGEGVEMILVNPQTPPKADILLKQLQDQGVEVALFGNDVVVGGADMLAQYSELTEGMIGAMPFYDAANPNFVELENTYKEKTGKEALEYPTYMATTYDAVMLLRDGLAQVGTDANALRDYLYSVDGWSGLAGSLTIDSNGDPATGHKPVMVSGGKASNI